MIKRTVLNHIVLILLASLTILSFVPGRLFSQDIPGYKLRASLFLETPEKSPGVVLTFRQSNASEEKNLNPTVISAGENEIRHIFHTSDHQICSLHSTAWIWSEAAWLRQTFNHDVHLFILSETLLEVSFTSEREHQDPPQAGIVPHYCRLTVTESGVGERHERFKVRFPLEEQDKIFSFCDSQGNRYFVSLGMEKQGIPLDSISSPSCRFVRIVSPEYPLAARLNGLEGQVVVKGVTDIYGRTLKTQVLSGPGPLREVSETAVKKWVVEPYIISGIPKPITYTAVFHYHLDRDTATIEKIKTQINARATPPPRIFHTYGSICPVPRLEDWIKPIVPKTALKTEGTPRRLRLKLHRDHYGRVTEVFFHDGDYQLMEFISPALEQWVFEPLRIMKGADSCTTLMVEAVVPR